MKFEISKADWNVMGPILRIGRGEVEVWTANENAVHMDVRADGVVTTFTVPTTRTNGSWSVVVESVELPIETSSDVSINIGVSEEGSAYARIQTASGSIDKAIHCYVDEHEPQEDFEAKCIYAMPRSEVVNVLELKKFKHNDETSPFNYALLDSKGVWCVTNTHVMAVSRCNRFPVTWDPYYRRFGFPFDAIEVMSMVTWATEFHMEVGANKTRVRTDSSPLGGVGVSMLIDNHSGGNTLTDAIPPSISGCISIKSRVLRDAIRLLSGSAVGKGHSRRNEIAWAVRVTPDESGNSVSMSLMKVIYDHQDWKMKCQKMVSESIPCVCTGTVPEIDIDLNYIRMCASCMSGVAHIGVTSNRTAMRIWEKDGDATFVLMPRLPEDIDSDKANVFSVPPPTPAPMLWESPQDAPDATKSAELTSDTSAAKTRTKAASKPIKMEACEASAPAPAPEPQKGMKVKFEFDVDPDKIGGIDGADDLASGSFEKAVFIASMISDMLLSGDVVKVATPDSVTATVTSGNDVKASLKSDGSGAVMHCPGMAPIVIK